MGSTKAPHRVGGSRSLLLRRCFADVLDGGEEGDSAKCRTGPLTSADEETWRLWRGRREFRIRFSPDQFLW